MLGVEARLLARNRVEAGRDGRAGFGDPLPALGRFRRLDRLLGGLGGAAGQRDDVVVGRPAHRIARRIGVIRRPLSAGALAEHAPQAQEDEHCQRQENDGVDIEHVSHALVAVVTTEPRTSWEAAETNQHGRRRFPHYYLSTLPD